MEYADRLVQQQTGYGEPAQRAQVGWAEQHASNKLDRIRQKECLYLPRERIKICPPHNLRDFCVVKGC